MSSPDRFDSLQVVAEEVSWNSDLPFDLNAASRSEAHPSLGHASVAFTMDVYAASLPDHQEEAADKLERMLGGG